MPRTPLEYLYAGLVAAAALLLLVGLVVFWGAISFEGYVGALLLIAVAFASFQGARELKRIATAPGAPEAQDEKDAPQEPTPGA